MTAVLPIQAPEQRTIRPPKNHYSAAACTLQVDMAPDPELSGV